ncbi:serine protease [Magnetospirillum fulvum MGU-K5]|uniref:Serine protease n=2 Tax=Magnetospirillum fulvum TaxID=1082 RepID=S9S830_MAGFU|nr:serine protease [Magnetospirillum fulvum MGU-K5]
MASAESFKTNEYLSGTGLNFIRAADAYALGYTGAGITLGMIDTSVRGDHPELAGKVVMMALPFDTTTGQTYVPNWAYDTHGSHVAGIMAALRNGVGMHGVAFDANLVSAVILGTASGSNENLVPPDLLSLFAAHPEIRVINNSWGSDFYPSLDPLKDIPADVISGQDGEIRALRKLSDDYGKVIVFAAGNNSMIAPNVEGMMPRYAPDLTGWISVVSLNTAGITTATDGTRTIGPSGVSYFSNLGSKAYLWTVAAPGSNIISLNATTNGYMQKSGTSMAAPYVSGTVGLVAQAFPWMTGKQLADAVLTTADSTFIAPTHLVQYTSDDGRNPNKVIITVIDHSVPTPNDVTIKQWIEQVYQGTTADALKALVDQGKKAVNDLTKEDVFGQGLLDAGKAVRGIARLDANRMSASDVVALPELAPGNYALETFNTKGYVAEFSNDITQRQWNDAYHHASFLAGADATALRGKDVGLRKTGAGLLVLSGVNSYSGATVVDGGSLAVSKRADGSGGVLQNSDVLVRQGGVLLGDGAIQKRAVNSGTVAPGYRGLTLTVNDYTQTGQGTLQIGFNSRDQYSVLSANSANLDGALRFSPSPGFYAEKYSININSVQATSSTGAFNSVGVNSSSPTLNFSVASSNGLGAASLGQQRVSSAYSRYADSTTTSRVGRALYQMAGQATGDMQNLFQALDWSDASGSDIAPAMEQLSPNSYDAVARAGLEAQRQLNLLMVRRFLGANGQQGASGTGVSSSAAADRQAWALPFSSYSNMNANGGSAGFSASGAGSALGVDRLWESGLTAGFDLVLAGRRTDIHSAAEARAETQAASVGGHARFKPRWWDGAYAVGMARVGFEDVQMQRAVNFNGYARNHNSKWTGLTADTLVGGGKNWDWATAWGGVEAGPLAWLEYSLSSRPGFTEGGSGASALRVDAATYNNLSSVLGAHANLARTLDNGTTLTWDTLAGWRHDRLDGTFSSSASFKGYSPDFESRSDMQGRDAMLVHSSVRASHISGFFAQVDLGSEFFRPQSSSCFGSFSFGLEF